MKLIFASDSFKGTLPSAEICRLLERAAREVLGDAECIGIPVADGGEGTVDAVLAAAKGEKIPVRVHGPRMEEREACYGRLQDGSVIMEMASASGLTLVPPERRNPLYTTSFGTGEMIRHALEQGCRDICIAIGGSATNDGGMGCLSALGARFLDKEGNRLTGAGEDLEKAVKLDLSELDPRLRETKLTVMCDVTNPLCGENGATRVYGPQKGGTEEILDRLEAGMRNYRDLLQRELGVDPDEVPGSGAAGGLGAALALVLGGRMRSGIDTVLELVHFDALLKDADLVITGEGRADAQSCQGKVMQGVGRRAKAAGVPVIGLCGCLGEGAEGLLDFGIRKLLATAPADMPLEEAMARAEELYHISAVRMFRDWQEERGCMERELSFTVRGRKIYGRLFLTKETADAGRKKPAVILSHGFNGNIDGIAAYARELAAAGILAYAYEFPGGGLYVRSEGKTTEMSVLTETEDLKAVLEQIISLPEVDPDRIFLMGESQGGFVSTCVAAAQPDRIRGLIALYPAYVLQDDARDRVKRRGYIPEVEEVMGVPLGRIYTEDAVSFDIYDRMPAFRNPVLLIHGTADGLVPIRYSERAAEIFPDAELVRVEGADHGFTGKDWELALKEMIRFVRKTADE